ncbi:hypothetical protein niasHS_014246 [Heterodera schachtii]|uniref:Uncharacterized protein n=1 Tax=Heterodera schachtii TaxID=97005 RepID=A0ABD2IBH1_HETSC
MKIHIGPQQAQMCESNGDGAELTNERGDSINLKILGRRNCQKRRICETFSVEFLRHHSGGEFALLNITTAQIIEPSRFVPWRFQKFVEKRGGQNPNMIFSWKCFTAFSVPRRF